VAALAVVISSLCAPGARGESAPPRDTNPTDAWPYCTYGRPEISPAAGTLPANWPSFSIALTGSVMPRSTQMTRLSDGHVVPLVFGPNALAIDFAPTEALIVGETYVVEHPACVGALPHTTIYDVVAPIAQPRNLGTLESPGLRAQNLQRGACHLQYLLTLMLHEDPELAVGTPWSSLPFWWAVEVDGGPPQNGNPLRSYSTTVAYEVQCVPSARGLAPGPHTFVGTASPWSDGGPISFSTPPASVTIDCATAVRVDAMTGAVLTDAEIAYWDTDADGSCGGPPMDGAVSMDAGASVDGALHTEPDTGPNCGCGVGRRSGWPVSLLLALLFGVARRRARQSFVASIT
jgi:hypothetical protein